jgi:uncharacterized cupredoxin-like copper-binding protein
MTILCWGNYDFSKKADLESPVQSSCARGKPVKTIKRLAGLAFLATASATFAHGTSTTHASAAPSRAEQTEWGIAGSPGKVTRTIALRMTDAMRFEPDRIEVRQGDTIRLRVANRGRLLHEIVLGTSQALDAHAELMKKYPGMEHDEAHMAHVPAGRKGEIVWTFNRTGEFAYACLIPGHFEAGMVGKILVTSR